MKPRNYYYLHIRFLKFTRVYIRLEENAHDFLRVPIGAGVLVHSFSMYSFVLDFSITQQQLINETLSFFYSYSFISLSLSWTPWVLLYLHVFERFVDLLYRNRVVIPCKIVILGEKEHAMTLLSLAHRDARAVPETSLHFSFFIVVVSARAKRRAESIFMLG